MLGSRGGSPYSDGYNSLGVFEGSPYLCKLPKVQSLQISVHEGSEACSRDSRVRLFVDLFPSARQKKFSGYLKESGLFIITWDALLRLCLTWGIEL